MEKYPFGGRVRAARKQLGITGEKLSEACNIDPSYLRQIECGIKLPSLSVFIILCRELSVSPEVLLADYLPAPVYEERDRLHELYRTLTPEQRDLAVRLLDSMRESLTSGEQEEV